MSTSTSEENNKLMSMFLQASNKKGTSSIVNEINSRNIVNPTSMNHTFIVESDIITLNKIQDGYTIVIINRNSETVPEMITVTCPLLIPETIDDSIVYRTVPQQRQMTVKRSKIVSLFTSQPIYILDSNFVYSELTSYYIYSTIILKSINGCLYQISNNMIVG